MPGERGVPVRHPCWIAQHIGLAWVETVYPRDDQTSLDLGFRVIEKFKERNGLDYRLQELTVPDGPALRFIDSVGNTLFNEEQVAALIQELREMRTRCQAPDLVAHIDALIAFASRPVQPHTFLWFIGD